MLTLVCLVNADTDKKREIKRDGSKGLHCDILVTSNLADKRKLFSRKLATCRGNLQTIVPYLPSMTTVSTKTEKSSEALNKDKFRVPVSADNHVTISGVKISQELCESLDVREYGRGRRRRL